MENLPQMLPEGMKSFSDVQDQWKMGALGHEVKERDASLVKLEERVSKIGRWWMRNGLMSFPTTRKSIAYFLCTISHTPVE